MHQYLFDDKNKNEKIIPLYGIDLNQINFKTNKNDNVILFNVGDQMFLLSNNGLICHINN